MSSAGSATLEQLIALNDEITSLVRAGVPLEEGLQRAAEDGRDGAGRLSQTLSEHLNRGESLPAALKAEGQRFPKIYQAVVSAGLRAGRLPAALEALSVYGWELVELRKKIGTALAYPVIVILLAYWLFLVFILELVERLRETYEVFHLPVPWAIRWLITVRETTHIWAWIPPVVLLACVGAWMLTGGTQLLSFRGFSRPLGWLLDWIARNYRYATFSELLAVLVENEVPLDEAVVLAAEATGDADLERAAERLAERTRRGEPPKSGMDRVFGFPPFLGWLLAHGHRQGSLPSSLRHAADRYRNRADEQAAWFQLVFPIVAGLGVGGLATLLYAVTLFLPFTQMLGDLSLDPPRM